ncbi:MAG: ABC transporter substrate-binding protein [Deltaproteobacteria bacterium]|nr:ABC transporter substrate-binding protein [Deltaproteobacteria bacterium]MBW2136851.1 ABC transporter substrate-binding protein [Deltaproteobacteria bacterium]
MSSSAKINVHLKLVVCVLALFIAFVAIPPLEAKARNIKVGIIDTYSGPPAMFCKEALNGFKLALKGINEKGVLGRKIEYTTRDTKFKVDIGLSVAKELIMREGVDVLVGVISSSVALAVSDYARREKVPLIVWIAKSERITGQKGHRYVFSTSENTAMFGKAGGVALAKKPFTKYWIAGDDYEYGHAIADAAWRNLKKLKPNVQLLGQSWWKIGEPDLVPYITAILAAKPDAVIFCTGGASMVNVMKTAKATGLTSKVQAWVHTATETSILRALGPGAPEGVMGTSDYLFYYPDTPANRGFASAFQAEYGAPPGFSGFHGYITAHLIAEAFRKAGSVDKEKFIDALEGLRIDSPAGEIEMRACDHQAVLPIFMGVTKKTPQYDFLTASDIITLTGDDVMPSCDEIREARSRK